MRRATMPPILVTADVDENHRVTLKLPDNVPAGKVILRIEIIHDANDLENAGLAAYKVMSDEEEVFGRSLVGSRPMEDYVYEDREERFD
jgi:hypothetical protein